MFAKSSMLDAPHGFEYASPPPQDHSDILGDLLHEVLNFVVVSSCGYRNEDRLGRDLQNLAKREGGLKTYSNRGSYPSKQGDSKKKENSKSLFRQTTTARICLN